MNDKAIVLKILDRKKIIVSLGINDDIEIGDEITVVAEPYITNDFKGNELSIPITKEILKVINVYENFSICSKVKEYESNTLSLGLAMASAFSNKREEVLDLTGYEDMDFVNLKDSIKIEEGDKVLVNGVDYNSDF